MLEIREHELFFLFFFFCHDSRTALRSVQTEITTAAVEGECGRCRSKLNDESSLIVA